MSFTKPFLKWPGGKFKLLDRIRSRLDSGNRLVEPFVGSGAVFLNAGFKKHLLADTNPDLINLYHHVRKTVLTLLNTVNHFLRQRIILKNATMILENNSTQHQI